MNYPEPSKFVQINNDTNQSANIVMYIFVNIDLKMRTGRIAAQVSHITHLITDTIIRDIYESIPIPEYCTKYLQWCKNPITIVLKASHSELIDLLKLPHTLSFSDTIDSVMELTTVGMFPIVSGTHDLSKYKLL